MNGAFPARASIRYWAIPARQLFRLKAERQFLNSDRRKQTFLEHVPGSIHGTPQVVRRYVADDAGSINTYPAYLGAGCLLYAPCFLNKTSKGQSVIIEDAVRFQCATFRSERNDRKLSCRKSSIRLQNCEVFFAIRPISGPVSEQAHRQIGAQSNEFLRRERLRPD